MIFFGGGISLICLTKIIIYTIIRYFRARSGVFSQIILDRTGPDFSKKKKNDCRSEN